MFKDFKLKAEWTYSTNWTVKAYKLGYCIPVVKANSPNLEQAMEELRAKLFEYLESESD